MSKLNLTWTCHVCSEIRPDAQISVYQTDISEQRSLSAGTFFQNVRHCNDRSACIEGAEEIQFFKD